MNINYKKVLLTTALFTISTLIVVGAIILSLMYFVFTKEFANFCYSLGWDTFSSNLYLKDYEKNGDILSCYKSLNLKIKINDDKQTIEIYEMFVNDEEYDTFMSSIENSNELLSVGIIEKSTILNEAEYLEGKYIEALYDEGNFDKAFELSLNNFSELKNPTLKDQGVYSFNLFINENMSEEWLGKFNQTHDGFDLNLVDEMQIYFDDMKKLFEENKTVTKKLDKAYFLALCNRIMVVGDNINILNSLNSKSDLNVDNLSKMENVNNVVKELVKD